MSSSMTAEIPAAIRTSIRQAMPGDPSTNPEITRDYCEPSQAD